MSHRTHGFTVDHGAALKDFVYLALPLAALIPARHQALHFRGRVTHGAQRDSDLTAFVLGVDATPAVAQVVGELLREKTD
ncbi:MAG: hypothetical protein ACKO3O_07800 [Gammaproteobacteria bacterium]